MTMKHAAAIAAVLLCGASPSPQPPAATIHMLGSQFSPASASVHAGDTVLFDNDDALDHTVTGDSLNSGNIAAGKSWTYTFNTAGTYKYVCTYHAWMKGAITVSAP